MTEKVKDSDFGFITFNPEEIERVLNSFGMKKIKKAKCWFCKEDLWVHQIGHIMPDLNGKPIFLCANSVCFSGYCNEILD